MHNTSNAYSVLQAIAVTAGLAIVMWSVGLSAFQIANAAALTSISDTISDSTPSLDADHEIEFVATSGVGTSSTIVITFDPENQLFDLTGIVEADIQLLEGGVDENVGTNWTAAINTTADTITLTSDASSSIAPGATTTIRVGTNAGGTNQINNPASLGSYEISVAAGADNGTTEIVILDSVTVQAAVDTVFTFAVSGVAAGTAVGGTYTTGGNTSTTSIPFGELTAGAASTTAQQLSVSTNAANGFNVTVQVDQQLTSGLADIDGFANGAFTASPIAWVSPSGIVGSEETYGHWGISSDDTTDMALNFANGANFVSASTTPVTVFSHTDPVNGVGVGQGTTSVIYRAEVSALQEASDSYTATLTYVATPIF